jgi:FKBP-type peptidyl-prolyl cis-trans isomerase SlyD
MLIESGKVISIHFTLTNDAGKVIDSSSGREPMAYLHGGGNLVPGLERALEGRRVGDKFQVSVAPAEGYGERDEALLQQVPRRSFKGLREIKAGMQLQANTPQGMRVFTVLRIAGDMVTLDGNHPHAGKTLHFAVEITAIRAASAEEVEHGHIHGPGGHHH